MPGTSTKALCIVWRMRRTQTRTLGETRNRALRLHLRTRIFRPAITGRRRSGPESRARSEHRQPGPALRQLRGTDDRVQGRSRRDVPAGNQARNRFKILASSNPDKALAIGSAFKLYILGELVRAFTAGERKWSDVVPLKAVTMSLPSGILQEWPTGTRMTLQSLAKLMIFRSDNTAANHLLLALGREKVKASRRTLGSHAPKPIFPS
jgi:beta-lactamase class A